LLEALKDRYGEELVVFLDRAGYFYTRDLWYSPPKLPELNPLEECRDRLKERVKHRLVPDLPTLKKQIKRGFPTVEEPNIWNYLLP
jgi:hypothetical protein